MLSLLLLVTLYAVGVQFYFHMKLQWSEPISDTPRNRDPVPGRNLTAFDHRYLRVCLVTFLRRLIHTTKLVHGLAVLVEPIYNPCIHGV